MKNATIRLDGNEYPIRQFKIGDLEKVIEIFQTSQSAKVPFAVLRLAMKTNGHPELDDLFAGADEINAAFVTLMELNGMKADKPGELALGTA